MKQTQQTNSFANKRYSNNKNTTYELNKDLFGSKKDQTNVRS